MDIILTILGCLFISFIVSAIIFGIISSKKYEKNSNKSLIISTIVISFILFGLISMFNTKLSETEVLKSETETLKEDNANLQEEKDNLQSQLNDLQNEYENSEELNKLLTEQLESYRIEPYEL